MRLPAAATLALVLLGTACSNRPPSQETAPGPAAQASAAPTAAADVAYHYILTPPAPAPGSPAILEIAVNDQTIHTGTPYLVRVTTSPDVTMISVAAMGSTYTMIPAAPGRFVANGQVPAEVPFFFLNRSYTATVTAQTADGRSTSVPVTLRLER